MTADVNVCRPGCAAGMASRGERGMACFNTARRQPLRDAPTSAGCTQRSRVKPLARGRSSGGSCDKENSDAQLECDKSQDETTRRLKMELTDLRAETRQLR